MASVSNPNFPMASISNPNFPIPITFQKNKLHTPSTFQFLFQFYSQRFSIFKTQSFELSMILFISGLLMHNCSWARLIIKTGWSLVVGDGSCRKGLDAPLKCESQKGFGESALTEIKSQVFCKWFQTYLFPLCPRVFIVLVYLYDLYLFHQQQVSSFTKDKYRN